MRTDGFVVFSAACAYSLLRSVRSLGIPGCATVYLVKPVDAAELLEAVARLAKGRKQA